MRFSMSALCRKAVSCVLATFAVVSLSACGGGGGGGDTAATGTPVTTSNITLPTSVEVVTAK